MIIKNFIRECEKFKNRTDLGSEDNFTSLSGSLVFFSINILELNNCKN